MVHYYFVFLVIGFWSHFQSDCHYNTANNAEKVNFIETISTLCYAHGQVFILYLEELQTVAYSCSRIRTRYFWMLHLEYVKFQTRNIIKSQRHTSVLIHVICQLTLFDLKGLFRFTYLRANQIVHYN